MRMRKLVSRAKKYAGAKKAARSRLAIGAAGILLVLTTIVTASMFGSSQAAHGAPAAPAAPPVPASQRMIDNEKARIDVDAPIAAASASAAAQSAPVTVVGCLEQHDEGFRLKDTTGTAAPTARSWKSGFLKKHAASVDLVDSANRLKLKDHVGQRVAVTGDLQDREMRARALKRVAAACN